MDDSEADFFGDAGKEKRTLVGNLSASVDEEAVRYVASVAYVAGCCCRHRCSLCSVAVDDIDASDSAATIDVTVIVDVDVGVVGVVVIVIVIVVAVDVLGEQPLAAPSCPSLFPTVPLLCLVCKQFSSLPRQTWLSLLLSFVLPSHLSALPNLRKNWIN